MSATLVRPITIEEYEALPYAQTERMEVVRGELVEKMPPGYEHGIIQGLIMHFLMLWALATKAGEVSGEVGYALQTGPLTLRAPDVSFIRADRLPKGKARKGFPRIAPDLAIEVISDSERAKAIQEKLTDYFEAGVALVWTVWPERREVVAYTLDDEPRTCRLGDSLEFPDVLPGFSCCIDNLFPQDE